MQTPTIESLHATESLQPGTCTPKRWHARFWLVLLVGNCAAITAVAGAYQWSLAGVTPDELTSVPVFLDDRERSIKVEVFRPAQDKWSGHPAVFFLHGVEGPERYRGPHTQSCRWLADQGYLVFYVHYFDAVDYSDLWLLTPNGSLDKSAIDSRCRKDAARWCTAVLQVVDALSRRPDVDANRIALDGLSLGGFIALEVADEAQRDASVPDIQAVVANWAAQFELTECQPGFPAILHIHGELDEVVPLRDAQQSVREIHSVASQAELFVLPGAPHVARSRESDARTISFLASHLSAVEEWSPTDVAFHNPDSYRRKLGQ